jgi:DNA-binding HxlR family transcriptional regulator
MARIQLTGHLEPRDGWIIGDGCPIARTLEVLGTRSAFLILREAFYGATRFEQFVERARVSEPVAAARLKELHAHGLLERIPYREPGRRTRQEYRLTDKGAELLPLLVAMMQWGDRWQFDDGARVELSHAGCGATVGTVLRCTHGHDVAAGHLQLRRRDDDPSTAARTEARA